MTIEEIKQKLTMANVLHCYGHKADRNNRLNCPFHDDKTPSMQVYPKTQTAYCFSSNCKTHGKSMDVIDFIMHKEGCTKHEALKKCTAMITTTQPIQIPAPVKKPQTTTVAGNTAFLQKMFLSFRKGIFSSGPAKEYCQSRNLNYETLEIGFNSGQFHHGQRKDEQLISTCVELGLLIPHGTNSRTGGQGSPAEAWRRQAYKPFGNRGIVFPLKNKENEIVSFYFRSTTDNKNAKHYYLKNRQGLYPGYSNPDTKKLILTEAIIDAASLLQIETITKEYEVLSCYGTNGLTDEIQSAIAGLKQLEEVVFMFDNDNPGKEAVQKYSGVLQQLKPGLKTTNVALPGKDVNETLQGHQPEIFTALLEQRQEIKTLSFGEGLGGDFSFSIEDKTIPEEPQQPKPTTSGNTIDFLKQDNLLKRLNDLIEQAGIVGEEKTRLLLFIIAISYKTRQPLHAIVQGSSGSGKTHLISKVADLMPPEDVLRFTRITESSLYNWGEYDLVNKLLIIEDLDGLKEEALFAMRELISNQRLSSSVSIKDKKGNIKSVKKEVKGVFSSLSATTKGEIYEDNMSRSFLLAVDESKGQTDKIISYQNRRIAGEINPEQQQQAKELLQKIVRALKEEEVQNPYATQIQLPENVQKKRRLNEMFQSIIKQITIINQYQRRASAGRIITQIEDIEDAVDILFDSIILKIDELDGSLRQFFEKLKKKFRTDDFTRFEAMEATGFKKTQLQHYLNQLVQLEYLKQFGHGNKGYKYRIFHFDDIQSVRKKLKNHFTEQIKQLKPNTNERQTNTNRTLQKV